MSIKTKILIHISIISQSIDVFGHIRVNLSLKTVKYINSTAAFKVNTNIHEQTCTIYVDYI